MLERAHGGGVYKCINFSAVDKHNHFP